MYRRIVFEFFFFFFGHIYLSLPLKFHLSLYTVGGGEGGLRFIWIRYSIKGNILAEFRKIKLQNENRCICREMSIIYRGIIARARARPDALYITSSFPSSLHSTYIIDDCVHTV